MPTDTPAIMASASGVSNTRLKPKRSRRPWVARNTPPLTPMSSPSMTTLSSSSMARCRARLTASSRVIFFCSVMLAASVQLAGSAGLQQLALIGQGGGPLGVDIVHGRLGRLLADRFIGQHRSLQLRLAVGNQGLFTAFVPPPLSHQIGLQALDRFFLPGLLDLFGRPVTGGIVGSGVIAEAIAQALQQHRALAVPGTLQGLSKALIDRHDIVAIDLLASKAGTDGLLRQGRRAALNTPRHGDGPLVVVDHKHHRQLPGTGDIQGFEKIALAGGAIATGGD